MIKSFTFFLRKLSPIFWVFLILFIGFLFFFYQLMVDGAINSDISYHLRFWSEFSKKGKIPFPPLYYFSFVGISLLLPGSKSLGFGMVILMVIFWVIKYFQTSIFLSPEISKKKIFQLIPFGFMFLFPIYLFGFEKDYLYLGKMVPNLWHNGSTVFVFPFCIFLFQSTIQWIKSKEYQMPYNLLIWSILILLSKLNYLLCFIPAFILMLFFEKTYKKKIIVGFIFSGLLFFFIYLSKVIIFDYQDADSLFFYFKEKGKINFDPFSVWEFFSESPILEFLSSFLFIIFSLILFGKELIDEIEFRFSSLVAIFGIIIYLLLAEEGERFTHANFYWQIPIALFILHLVIVKFLLGLFLNRKCNDRIQLLKFYFLGLLFGLHVISGFIYIIHYLVTGQYF